MKHRVSCLEIVLEACLYLKHHFYTGPPISEWVWVVAIPEEECLFCLGDFLIRERTGIVGFLSES